MHARPLIAPAILLLLSSGVPAVGTDVVRHSTGAQCHAIDWPGFDSDKSKLLHGDFSKELLSNEAFRLTFTAQSMPFDGYPIVFNDDNSVETTSNFDADRWELSGNTLVLYSAEKRQAWRFRYSENCKTLVHEYELFGTPSVVEIAIVSN